MTKKNSYHKEYYEKNKIKLREYQREYYHRNKNKVKNVDNKENSMQKVKGKFILYWD